jgi:hypothetical protein
LGFPRVTQSPWQPPRAFSLLWLLLRDIVSVESGGFRVVSQSHFLCKINWLALTVFTVKEQADGLFAQDKRTKVSRLTMVRACRQGKSLESNTSDNLAAALGRRGWTLALQIQSQLLTEEKILGGQNTPWPKAQSNEPQSIPQ